MRYHNFRAFCKHLQSAAPDHLCRYYFVAVEDDYERKMAVSAVLSYFPKSSIVRLSGTSVCCRELIELLFSPSLFGGESLVFLDDADKVGKKEIQTLSSLMSSASPCGYFLSASRSKTILSSTFEKVGVVLDLIDEKPWDKEKRLTEQVGERVARAGKRIAADALALLFERLGMDAAFLDSEIDKLVCFIGEKPMIERSDVFRVSALREKQVWQMVEEIVWEGGAYFIDASFFHTLIPALRSQFQTGLKILDLLDQATPRDQWSLYLPRIWPKMLEKRISQVMRLGRIYFLRGLELLFDVECLSRTGSTREHALLDFFRFSLQATVRDAKNDLKNRMSGSSDLCL